MEFFTSVVTALCIYVLGFLQYEKENKYWYLFIIIALVMTVNAYLKYKQMKKDQEK